MFTCIFVHPWLPELACLWLMHPLITNVSTVCHDGQGECLINQTGLTPGEVSSHQCDEEEMPRDYRHHPETETPTVRPPSPPAGQWRFDVTVMKLWALLCLLLGLLCVWWLRHSPRKATRSQPLWYLGQRHVAVTLKEIYRPRGKNSLLRGCSFHGLWSSQSCVI